MFRVAIRILVFQRLLPFCCPARGSPVLCALLLLCGFHLQSRNPFGTSTPLNLWKRGVRNLFLKVATPDTQKVAVNVQRMGAINAALFVACIFTTPAWPSSCLCCKSLCSSYAHSALLHPCGQINRKQLTYRRIYSTLRLLKPLQAQEETMFTD